MSRGPAPARWGGVKRPPALTFQVAARLRQLTTIDSIAYVLKRANYPCFPPAGKPWRRTTQREPPKWSVLLSGLLYFYAVGVAPSPNVANHACMSLGHGVV